MPPDPPSYGHASHTCNDTSPPLIHCMHHFVPPYQNVWMKHWYVCHSTHMMEVVGYGSKFLPTQLLRWPIKSETYNQLEYAQLASK